MPFWNKDSNFKKKLERKLCIARETPEPIFDLAECNLHEVPDGVFSLCRVFLKEILLLQTNQLQSLHSGGSMKDLSMLKVLKLDYNKFSSLPDDIGSLISLEVLSLENNQLKKLPESICSLSKLNFLNLNGNKFREFPMVLCKLSSLRNLKLCGNEKVKTLPLELSSLTCLANLEIDSSNMSYPPSGICFKGTEHILKFLCSESGKDYAPPIVTEPQDKGDCSDTSQTSSPVKQTGWEDPNISAAYQLYQQAKDQRRQELLQMEEAMRQADVLQAQLASDAFSKRQKLLEDVTVEQEKMDREIIEVQTKKGKERKALLAALSNIEDHSAQLIDQLMRLNEKNKNLDTILEQLEQDRIEAEELFTIKQEELEALRKQDTLDAMRNMLHAEEKQRKYELDKLQVTRTRQDTAYEDDGKLMDVLSGRALDQQALVHMLIEEEQYQKEAFEALLLQKDKRHQEINYQIMLIENELLNLTLAELRKQDLRADLEINVLAERRSTLAQMLADLLEAKEVREKELKKRLMEMEDKNLNEVKDFWILQYQKLMDRKPPEVVDTESGMDPVVRLILVEAGAVNYIPLFAIKAVSVNEMLLLTFIEFKKLGVLDDTICEAILSKCQEYKKSMQLESDVSNVAPGPSAPELLTPTAPVEEPEVEVEPSAPLISPDTELRLFCQTECVVCLDKQSTAVFIPCGHVCCCWACSNDLTNCPMCRHEISAKFILAIP